MTHTLIVQLVLLGLTAICFVIGTIRMENDWWIPAAIFFLAVSVLMRALSIQITFSMAG